MADGFQGFSVSSSRKLSIQKPIGFFGFSIVLANAPNLYITVLCGGEPLRNTLVTAINTTSGIPDSNTTDGSGNVALKADSITDIALKNGVFNEIYSYNRGSEGSQIIINFEIPLLI